MKRFLLFLILIAACTTPPAAPPAPPATPPALSVVGPKLMPVDEYRKDPSLQKFRDEMLDIIRNKASERLFAKLHPAIRTSFGPGGGIEEFKEGWSRRPLWDELAVIFNNGGSFRGPTFWAPYVYSNWPETIDPFSYWAVISPSTPLRESADPNSKVIATLSYDIVTRLRENAHVRTADGKEGWVDPKVLWSPVGYRVAIAPKDGTWTIDALVAGD